MWERIEIYTDLQQIMDNPRGEHRVKIGPLNGVYFRMPDPFIDEIEIFFVRRNGPIIVMVPAGLQYIGDNPLLGEMFNSTATVRGWRPIFNAATCEDAIKGIERALGRRTREIPAVRDRLVDRHVEVPYSPHLALRLGAGHLKEMAVERLQVLGVGDQVGGAEADRVTLDRGARARHGACLLEVVSFIDR